MPVVLECPKCKGRMKILAVMTKPARVRRILDHLGLPSVALGWKSRPPPQIELVDAPECSDDFYADSSSSEE